MSCRTSCSCAVKCDDCKCEKFRKKQLKNKSTLTLDEFNELIKIEKGSLLPDEIVDKIRQDLPIPNDRRSYEGWEMAVTLVTVI